MCDYDPTVPDRKPRLSDEAIETAILWLESNEGDEVETLQNVADWFKTEMNHRIVRRLAKSFGQPITQMRDSLARATGDGHE